MDEQAIRSRSDDPREEALRMATPLRMAWHKMYFDLPLAMWSEAMRFAGQGLQAQGEFFSGLRMCRSVADTNGSAVGFREFRRHQRWEPVAAKHVAHRRSGAASRDPLVSLMRNRSHFRPKML